MIGKACAKVEALGSGSEHQIFAGLDTDMVSNRSFRHLGGTGKMSRIT